MAHPLPDTPSDPQRLNKFVALSLGISRRSADELINKGAVTINSQVAQLGDRVKAGDSVNHKGHPITPQQKTYLMLNKPVGFVCSRRKQGDAPTIYSLIPTMYHHLKPVGRLDKDSSGLILLTNDGDFAHRMTHPSYQKQKRYLVTLSMPLQPIHHQMINDIGINLPDGRSQLTLSRQHDGDHTRWVVQMKEGRNRQIRRTFSALGYTVTKLHRTDFGNYSLGDIKPGQYKFIGIS